MKVVEVFKPYKIPLQGLVISNDSFDNDSQNQKQKTSTPHSLGEISFQNSRTDFSEKTEDKEKIFQFKLKKRSRQKEQKKSCFKCRIEDCDQLFDTLSEMEKHLNQHKIILNCSIEGCNLKFINNHNYLKHMKTHTSLGKKYVCPFSLTKYKVLILHRS